MERSTNIPNILKIPPCDGGPFLGGVQHFIGRRFCFMVRDCAYTLPLLKSGMEGFSASWKKEGFG